jgi:hypothetical protein
MNETSDQHYLREIAGKHGTANEELEVIKLKIDEISLLLNGHGDVNRSTGDGVSVAWRQKWILEHVKELSGYAKGIFFCMMIITTALVAEVWRHW